MSETILSVELSKNSKTVIDYLQQKHQSIVNDYHTVDGKYSEQCGLIALEIADSLIKDGREPCIMEVSEYVIKNGSIHSKKLSPKIYGGRVSWRAHQVCFCDGLAFDPILDEPISTQDYTKEIFGENIKTEILLPTDKIKEFIGQQLYICL